MTLEELEAWVKFPGDGNVSAEYAAGPTFFVIIRQGLGWVDIDADEFKACIKDLLAELHTFKWAGG